MKHTQSIFVAPITFNMNSGIYVLKFPSGKYYIGKTNNFTRRWNEHAEKMRKGTAARSIQLAYEEEGFPTASVLFECHPDHTELLEKYYIAGNTGPNMLNSTIPATGDQEELDILNANNETLKNSTASLCVALSNADRKHTEVCKKLEEVKRGTRIPELEQELAQSYNDIVRYGNELHRVQNLGLWDRIFKNY